MALLEVVINSRVYQVGCDEGEKEYITSLVSDLNHRINKLKQQNPSFFTKLTDEKLFLYQMLLMCSEIKDLKKLKKQNKNIAKESADFNNKEINRINTSINTLKKNLNRLDDLIKQ